MAVLIVKLIVCPLVLILSDFLFTEVYYSFIYQVVIIGIILAVISHILETLVLNPGTLWILSAVDFIVIYIVVFYSQFFLFGVTITPVGALLATLLLFIPEYIQHIYLIKNKRFLKIS